MKKILILYAKYGGGHKSAANSLQSYIENHYSRTCTVNTFDCMDYISPFLSRSTTSAYKRMAKRAPLLWKKLYYDSKAGALFHLSNGANELMAKKLYKLINEMNPDLIISVVPFASEMTNYLKSKGLLTCELATVMTDFAPHEQWLLDCKYCDYFFVSNDKMANTLHTSYDIPAEKIHVTGIPLANTFSYPFYDDETYTSYNLKKDKKLILFFGGGEFGLSEKSTMQILRSLCKYLDLYQIIAISGKNKKLNDEFLSLSEELKNPDLHVLKYTNNVPELMHISSLVVTKPGGLTSSESLASNLPMLIINPIPGQEEENAQFLEDAGAAVWLKKNDNVDTVISNLLNDSEKLEKMKQCSTAISKPNSTRDICRTMLGDPF